jgi:hypothetical protein
LHASFDYFRIIQRELGTIPQGGARRGAGRPKIFETVTKFSVVLEKSDVEALERLAKWKRESLSAYSRKILRRHILRTKIGVLR